MKRLVLFFFGLSGLPSAGAETLDMSSCVMGLPGYNAIVAFEPSGRLVLEGSKFYEKQDTEVRGTTLHRFRTRNRPRLTTATTKAGRSAGMVNPVHIESVESRDFLKIARNSAGRITEIEAVTQDSPIKKNSLVETMDGDVALSPLGHKARFRYEGAKCLKTYQDITGNDGKVHILYDEAICETLFPFIERATEAETRRDPRLLTQLTDAFRDLEAKTRLETDRDKPLARRPSFGPELQLSEGNFKLLMRSVSFADQCIAEHGNDIKAWKAKRRASSTAVKKPATQTGGADHP